MWPVHIRQAERMIQAGDFPAMKSDGWAGKLRCKWLHPE